MLRTTIALFLACLAIGCTSSPSPPPVTPPPGEDAPQTSAAPQSPPPQVTASPPAKNPAADPSPAPATLATPVPDNTALRDLASRLIESDGQSSWRINEKAATELEKLGPEAVASLWTLLTAPSDGVRRGTAFYLLGQFDAEDAKQVAAFSALLNDADKTIRGLGLSALQQMRREDQIAALPKALPLLDPAREPTAAHRAAVARFCGTLKTTTMPLTASEDTESAIAPLITASSRDPDAKVRAAALNAVYQIASPTAAVEPLSAALKDPEPAVRLVAATRLKQLGKAHLEKAAPQIAAALADSDERIRDAAAATLIDLGAPAVEPLASQLTSTNLDARKFALACLAKIGPPAKSSLPAIEKCKQDPDAEVRKLAAAAYKKIDVKTEPPKPAPTFE